MEGLELFWKFADSLKKFQRALFTLIASSFVFSAVGIVAQVDRFDTAFLVISELTSGVVGAAAILLTYLAWWEHPKDDFDRLISFRPSRFAFRIGGWFISSAGFLYVYYALAQSGSRWCLVFLSLGCFLFFCGLVQGLLVVQTAEIQRTEWSGLSADDKQRWRARLDADEANERKKPVILNTDDWRIPITERGEKRYVHIDRMNVSEQTARSLLAALSKLGNAESERTTSVVLVLGPSASLAYEAKKLLSEAGVEVEWRK